MLETNVRIVAPGRNLWIAVRRLNVKGSPLTEDVLERACGALRYRDQIAAKAVWSPQPHLLAAIDFDIDHKKIEGDDWVLELTSTESERLDLSTDRGRALAPALAERALLVSVASSNLFWTLDSPRIWYERSPFISQDGIEAFRRYEISSEFIEGEGVGIIVDAGTAFFAANDLAWFFAPTLDRLDSTNRLQLFQALSGRQQGQKGTLLYDTGRVRKKCYFVDAPEGATCGRTPPIKVRGKTYDSLLHYYRETNPGLPVAEDDPAVLVSFPNLDRAQWAAAKRLRVRVMNDDLPKSLKQADKIEPEARRELILSFWKSIGLKPFGRVAPGIREGFWCPSKHQVSYLQFPVLAFNKGYSLSVPIEWSRSEIRSHFHSRAKTLTARGCYSLPSTTSRTIYVAYPERLNEREPRILVDDLAALLTKWSSRQFETALVPYSNVSDAASKLRRTGTPAFVLFVLDREPLSYFEASFQLPGWRLKRVTEATLREHHSYLDQGAWDRRAKRRTLEEGKRRWDGYVQMNAYDVLQQMDGVPWTISDLASFEATLGIDVSHDRRFVAASLLVARDPGKTPFFRIQSQITDKPDSKHEAVNPILLRDLILQLFQKVFYRKTDALQSLLCLRDGKWVGEERRGLEEAITKLREIGVLAAEANVERAELHKSTQKGFRLWEIDQTGGVRNPMEGSCVLLAPDRCILATTGDATLHQGTAEPLLLVHSDGKAILPIAEAAFAGCQLNWSSPGVAQRLPLIFKRTDEDLENRLAQEIRKIA